MAVSRLPVYNATRRLFEQIELSTKKAPINMKRGIIAKAEDSIISVMEHLSFADEAIADVTRRRVFIRQAIRIMKKTEIRVRILYDLHLIKKTGFSAIMLLEDDVTRQLQGWLNATEKEIEKNNTIPPVTK